MNPDLNNAYDALLLVSFGGPEGPEDVLPFLQQVTRGRNIPEARLQEVAEHYHHFGGVSPHNQQIRQLLEAWKPLLRSAGVTLPVFWGNRNWHPFLEDTLREMAGRGIRRVLALVFAGYSSYSSCRQYRQNVQQAIDASGAPVIFDKIRVFFNHPGFINALRDRVRAAVSDLPASETPATILCTAHSIPLAMAARCSYAAQLAETTRLVGEAFAGHPIELVYQSRSGPPQVPWLSPDVLDRLRTLKAAGVKQVVVAPIGFLSDHMEVLYDLDCEAADLARELGLDFRRAGTVGTHPDFLRMLTDLVRERLDPSLPRQATGCLGPAPDVCPADCCLPAEQPR